MRSNISAQRAIDGFQETKDLTVMPMNTSAELQILRKKQNKTQHFGMSLFHDLEIKTHAVNQIQELQNYSVS